MGSLLNVKVFWGNETVLWETALKMAKVTRELLNVTNGLRDTLWL